MDLNFFSDPQLAPKPRSEIRIESLVVTLLPDGNRLSVEFDTTPFLPIDRPSISLAVRNTSGAILSSSHVIESVHEHVHITLHLPQPLADTNLIVHAELYYGEEPPQADAYQRIDVTNPTP